MAFNLRKLLGTQTAAVFSEVWPSRTIIADMVPKCFRLHDGVTPGGIPMVTSNVLQTRQGPAVTDPAFGAASGITVDSTAAIASAEASSEAVISLPAGKFNTTTRRGSLKKKYEGPGELRTDFLPANQTGNLYQQGPLWSGQQLCDVRWQ